MAPIDRTAVPASAARVALMAMTSERISILNYGGAKGVGYVHFKSTIRSPEKNDYYVIGNAPSCEAARQIFANDPRIHFLESLDSVPAADFGFMSGVPQSTCDSILRLIARRSSPKFFLLTLVPVGTFPTFASAQVNLPVSTMPA